MSSDFKKRVHQSRRLLQNPYAYLEGEGGYRAIEKAPELDVQDARRVLQNQYAYLDERGRLSAVLPVSSNRYTRTPKIVVNDLLDKHRKRRSFSKREIAGIVRNLHSQLWRRRLNISPDVSEVDPLKLLNPRVALECIGYSVEMEESLGQYYENGEKFEVAGILDNSNAMVRISRRFAPEVINFTTAHELGHAILHKESGLHRDRPRDGSLGSGARDEREIEADTFAAYFLLPGKLVCSAFEQRFMTEKFVLDEDTAFALRAESLNSVQRICRTVRDLSRALASAEYYNGDRFYSLAMQFGVSIGAMAIRLEELQLVKES